MEKNVAGSRQWYAVAIVILIFLLSIASWVEFVRNVGDILKSRFSAQTSVETVVPETAAGEITDGEKDESAAPIEETTQKAVEVTQDSRMVSLCRLVESAVNRIDSLWYIFCEPYLSRIDSIATYCATGEISAEQVIKGSDRWLFYGSLSDGDPIADYEGTNAYSQQRMDQLLEVVRLTQNELEDRGIRFALVVAPNKENIYSEYMPDRYRHAEKSRTDVLIAHLSSNGVNVASPKKELLDNCRSSQLYYAYDTHWNQLGAYIGVRETLAQWGITMPELSEREVRTEYLKENYHYCAEDDLAGIPGLRFIFSDEKEYIIEGTILVDWNAFGEEQESGGISCFYNENAAKRAKLLLVGDSFRTAMIPALGEQFSDVYVVHRGDYRPEMLDDIQPNYVIAEYVERYSDRMDSIYALVN